MSTSQMFTVNGSVTFIIMFHEESWIYTEGQLYMYMRCLTFSFDCCRYNLYKPVEKLWDLPCIDISSIV